MSVRKHNGSLLGMVTSPLLWAALFVGSYVLSGVGCAPIADGTLLEPGRVRVALFVLAGIAGGAVALLGIRQLRASGAGLHRRSEAADAGVAEPLAFLHSAAFLLSGLVVVGALWLTFNTALAPICGPA